MIFVPGKETWCCYQPNRFVHNIHIQTLRCCRWYNLYNCMYIYKCNNTYMYSNIKLHPGTCDPHHAVNPWGLVLPGSLSANVTCVERWDVCCCNAPWHTRLNPVGPWPWWFCSQFELQEKIELTLKPRPAYALCMHMRYCLTFCVEAGLPKIGRKKHP